MLLLYLVNVQLLHVYASEARVEVILCTLDIVCALRLLVGVWTRAVQGHLHADICWLLLVWGENLYTSQNLHFNLAVTIWPSGWFRIRQRLGIGLWRRLGLWFGPEL